MIRSFMLKGPALIQLVLSGLLGIAAANAFAAGVTGPGATFVFAAALFFASGWEDLLTSRTRRKLEMRATFWNLYLLNRIHGNPPTESNWALEADLLDEFHRLYGKDEKI